MHLQFCQSESAFDYMLATRKYVDKHGKPLKFYSDNASVFRANYKNTVGCEGQTQFVRAMNGLNITGNCADISSAKGHVNNHNFNGSTMLF